MNTNTTKGEGAMTLIEQYLAAVAAQLPGEKREDIVAELRDALMERIEAREAELGRAMTEAETESLLREFGHPLTVAARYRGGPDHLIGPELFPYWWFALKAALVVLVIVVGIGAVLSVAVGQASPVDAFAYIWDGLLDGGLMIIGLAAIAGFVIERQPNRPRFMTDWKVRDLELFRRWSLNGDGLNLAMGDETAPKTAMSKVARRNRSRAAEALWCVAVWTVFLLWWGGGFRLGGLDPQTLLASAAALLPGVSRDGAMEGLVQPLYWPVIAYGLVRIGLELARAASPHMAVPVALGDLVMAGASAAILAWVWTRSVLAPVAVIDSPEQLIERTADLFRGHFSLSHILVLILIFNALEIVGRVLGALRRLATARA